MFGLPHPGEILRADVLPPASARNDAAWLAVACRRLAEPRSGEVAAVPGEVVFARILSRFSGDGGRS